MLITWRMYIVEWYHVSVKSRIRKAFKADEE